MARRWVVFLPVLRGEGAGPRTRATARARILSGAGGIEKCRVRRPGACPPAGAPHIGALRAMPSPASPPALLAERRRVLASVVGRTLAIPPGTPGPSLPAERLEHLGGELESLYWNDLEWENLTEEEWMEGGSLPELTFPGVLALTRGLLLTEVAADALAAAEPRPEVVEAFLHFLAGRVLALREEAAAEPSEEADRAALELRMTAGLLDRVLVEYHGIAPEDVGTLEDV